ncbi:MAG: IclR family transcriptional regulator [Dermatophilaceae bacterium]
MSTENATGTQAIDRAADLVALVVRSPNPLSFSEIQLRSGLPRSTTSRLLSALERQGMLARTSSGAFTPGALFVAYAARHRPESALLAAAEPVMDSLGDLTGETVNLAVARGDAVVQIAQVDAQFVLGSREWVGVEVPPHCSALGKVLYAYGALPLPAGRLATPTPKSLARREALDRAGHGIRRTGVATTVDELEIGLAGIAVPVLDAAGRPVAALGLSGPGDRMVAAFDRDAVLLREHARTLSARLTTHTQEGAA